MYNAPSSNRIKPEKVFRILKAKIFSEREIKLLPWRSLLWSNLYGYRTYSKLSYRRHGNLFYFLWDVVKRTTQLLYSRNWFKQRQHTQSFSPNYASSGLWRAYFKPIANHNKGAMIVKYYSIENSLYYISKITIHVCRTFMKLIPGC